MKLRALLILVVIVAGLGLSSQGRASTTLNSRADTQTLRLGSVSLRRHTPTQVLRWLRHQPAVRSAARGWDRQTLEIRFRDGTRGLILPAWRYSSRLQQTGAAFHLQPLARARAPGARALVLEPFATELGLGPHAGEPEVNQLQAAGFQVDQLYDTQVTVNVMATLSQYDVVYMHTHSDPFGGGDGVVATGQLANDDAALATQLQNGTVVKVGVSGSNDVYYAITSSYIRTYEDQFPGNSIIFLNGCGLLNAPVFWQALASKGVGVMVAWDVEATSQDNYLSGAAFFAEMAKGLSVAAAITAEQAAGYGKSNVNGTQATLGFVGDGSITLQAAANSPARATSTPTPPSRQPTSVPTKPAPTSTPAPTPTRVPAPPLTVQLKYLKIEPGTRQVIQIKSAPDTIIHIHISFPNGDLRTDITATDGAGNARYGYLQRSSKVMYRNRFATVTVEAIKDQGVTVKTVKYLIRWSKLDVAVQPRVQAVDKMIQVWVHTQAHTKVTVALFFPRKGSVKRLHGRTGRHGWVHLYYRVGRYLKWGNDHTVLVRARVVLGSTQQFAETTFRII